MLICMQEVQMHVCGMHLGGEGKQGIMAAHNGSERARHRGSEE